MRLSYVSAFIGMAFISACSSTTVTTGYYKVSGITGKQLDSSIASNGPMKGHAFAVTELQILPVKVNPVEDGTGCYIRNSKFKVVAHITYPKWSERKGASKDLKRGFDIFSSYARVHEQTHVRIGEAAARDMEDAIEAITPQPDCDVLLLKMKAAIKNIYAKHDRDQRAFDAAEQKRLRKVFQG
jgi:predicted secreted Zn-dependent protease